MTASALWQFDQLSPEARTAADGAARHAGLPLAQWLGRLIAETAAAEGVTLGVAPRAVAPSRPRNRTLLFSRCRFVGRTAVPSAPAFVEPPRPMAPIHPTRRRR